MRSWLRPWVVVTVATLVYALAVVAAQGDSRALVTIGTRYADGDPASDEGTEGYDGQFVYYIAREPSDAARFLDVPAYRFQRILLPALGMALSFGQEALIPWALVAINLAAVAAGTALLERLLVEHGASRWYALGYGLSLGVLGAARLSLPEPLAYALALGGVALALRDKWLWSAVLFALAALAKETTLVMAAGVGVWMLQRRQIVPALAFGVIALAPFAAWQVALIQRLGEAGIGSGGALATPFEVVPFLGVVRILTEGGVGVFLVLGAILLPFVLLPTVWGIVQGWRDMQPHPLTPSPFQRKENGEGGQNRNMSAKRDSRTASLTLLSWLLLATAVVMLFVPFSTYREPVGILRFIVGLQIAVILYAAERRKRRTLRYSTLWAITVLFVVASDFSGGAR